eukprot:3516462-Karenia_brevis.AAC.1
MHYSDSLLDAAGRRWRLSSGRHFSQMFHQSAESEIEHSLLNRACEYRHPQRVRHVTDTAPGSE